MIVLASQGYALDESNRHCSAIGTYDAHLIFSFGYKLEAIDLKTDIVQTITLQGNGFENLVDSPQAWLSIAKINWSAGFQNEWPTLQDPFDWR